MLLNLRQLTCGSTYARVNEGSGESTLRGDGLSSPRNCRCHNSNTAREKSSFEYLPLSAFSARSFSTVLLRKYPLVEVSRSRRIPFSQPFKSPLIQES